MSETETEAGSLNTGGGDLVQIKYTFPNGDKYEGECSSSCTTEEMRSGTGTHTFASGMVYTGQWHHDKMHGRGRLQHPCGASYEGEFRNNMYHGVGTYTFSDGSVYSGHFCNNKLEGGGTFKDTQGFIWKGQFHGSEALGLTLQSKK